MITDVRILVTGGSGVLGRTLVPRLERDGHRVATPTRGQVDLFDAAAVAEAVAGTGAIYHLATRIPRPERMADPDAWHQNDRLRRDASRLLVGGALAAGTPIYVQPTVAIVYPPGPADETTLLVDVAEHLRSALDAEVEVLRFAAAGRTGVALRLGLLYGSGTATQRDTRFGATLHVEDAGRALAAALRVRSGICNVVEDENPVSNTRFRKRGPQLKGR